MAPTSKIPVRRTYSAASPVWADIDTISSTRPYELKKPETVCERARYIRKSPASSILLSQVPSRSNELELIKTTIEEIDRARPASNTTPVLKWTVVSNPSIRVPPPSPGIAELEGDDREIKPQYRQSRPHGIYGDASMLDRSLHRCPPDICLSRHTNKTPRDVWCENQFTPWEITWPYSNTAIQQYSNTAIQQYSNIAIQQYSNTAN